MVSSLEPATHTLTPVRGRNVSDGLVPIMRMKVAGEWTAVLRFWGGQLELCDRLFGSHAQTEPRAAMERGGD